jgi:hypothetical protein
MRDSKYTKLGYHMTTEVVREHHEGDVRPNRTLYIRVIIFYKDNEFFREDLFIDDIGLFDKECKRHQRELKLNQLLE